MLNALLSILSAKEKTMILNKMQSEVVTSKKRFVVVTAQAGAGTTYALIYKLLHELSKSPNNMGVFLRRTSTQARGHINHMLEKVDKARYSQKSGILTVPYGGKKVKIKFLGLDDLKLDEYIPIIAIDQASQFDNIPDIINCSGRVVLSDFISQIEEKDSWAYSTRLLRDSCSGPEWDPCVDHIVGYTHDNPGISPEYVEAVFGLDDKYLARLTRVKFKK